MRSSSRKENKVHVTALLAFCTAVFLSAGYKKQEQGSIEITEQLRIAYAPLQIMEEEGFLEHKLPGAQISQKRFNGPTGTREGMLSGGIDFKFMGVFLALIGVDNGMKWRYAAGPSSNKVAIATSRQEVRSLRGAAKEGHVVILSPTCTQHALLCMLAGEQLGDARALNSQLVSMSHPDPVNTLPSGTEVTVHVSTPPCIPREVDEGGAVVTTREDIMGGPFTFISCVVMEDPYKDHRDYYDALQEALKESVDSTNENPQESVWLLAPVYGITREGLGRQMGHHGTICSTGLNGVARFSQRTAEMGFISQTRPMDELVFDNVMYQ